MRPNRQTSARGPGPVLITEARPSGDEQFDQRRRKYLIMMGLRALCVVGAAVTASVSGWLAAAFLVGALVLPWTAVLIANDRPPKQAVRFRRFVPGFNPDGPRALSATNSGDHPSAGADEPAPAEAPPTKRNSSHTVIDL
ncbi:DUF3099 domain-containing protein [Jatrophihabitans telluris]|uniref:DUF3099 domain-containing protein n=1 Tax=Jatrophihabitans telluris TaxID=2038343 RepID=A0ABY4QV17_9ACTN|nr:DUF3099 domain-containing protein [Jatrophihabitans telluris]UQX86716.1 DUF3099 domain-containing protein [Jatrophihabitans telluris]